MNGWFMVVLTLLGWSFPFFPLVLPITNEVNELKKYKFDTAQLSMFLH